ncbi:MAG: imidazole glycerol phosphate synthase subunit HisH [Acidobacteria bacterium]|nr:imidazole glycerol phosphate synthase subunit HisH [Acidobacteriota bacterium]
MRVAIVRYNAGNTASVVNALGRLGVEPLITDSAEELASADKVIFPGVGEASSAMRYLKERRLDEVLRSLSVPVLGICLGMQLLCSSSEENDTECLGIVPLRVRRFPAGELKVPHMGWNTIGDLKGKLFDGVSDGSYVYFVHGYYVESGSSAIALSHYGVEFAAALEHENFFAVQFHPERSGAIGEQILRNFLNI